MEPTPRLGLMLLQKAASGLDLLDEIDKLERGALRVQTRR